MPKHLVRPRLTPLRIHEPVYSDNTEGARPPVERIVLGDTGVPDS